MSFGQRHEGRGNCWGMWAGHWARVTFYYSRASIMNACLAIIKCSGIPTSRKAGHTLHTPPHTHAHTYSVVERGCAVLIRRPPASGCYCHKVVAAGVAIKHFAMQCNAAVAPPAPQSFCTMQHVAPNKLKSLRPLNQTTQT